MVIAPECKGSSHRMAEGWEGCRTGEISTPRRKKDPHTIRTPRVRVLRRQRIGVETNTRCSERSWRTPTAKIWVWGRTFTLHPPVGGHTRSGSGRGGWGGGGGCGGRGDLGPEWILFGKPPLQNPHIPHIDGSDRRLYQRSSTTETVPRTYTS